MHQGIEYDDNRSKHKLLRLFFILFSITLLGFGVLLLYTIPKISFISNDDWVTDQGASAASTSLSAGSNGASDSPAIQNNPVAIPNDYTLTTRVGISFGDTLPSLSTAQLNDQLDDLASLGVGWIRIDMAWDDVQPKNSSTFNWTNLDRVMAAANVRHIKVLPILDYTPKWARPSSCSWSDKCAPADPAAFAAFAKAAVAHYGPQGISTWEIWNEPNINGFWKPTPDPIAYTALLKDTYVAIKSVAPSSMVISGGLAPANNDKNDIAPIDFLQDIYADGAQGDFDAVGFHPYTFPLSPDDLRPSNAWAQMADTDPSLRSVMIANGDSAKQIWMTEYGAPTGGPKDMATSDTYDSSDFDHVSESLQATLITDAVNSIQNVTWAGPLFIYSYKDLGTSSDTVENFFGLLRYDGTEKPAYTALKTILSTN